MFNFFGMMGNYKDRKIDRYETDDLIVDTCAVSDSDKPYETGISHKRYNNGDWIIVELYGTKEDAQSGHNKWV